MVPLNEYTYAQISICSLLIHIVYPKLFFFKYILRIDLSVANILGNLFS